MKRCKDCEKNIDRVYAAELKIACLESKLYGAKEDILFLEAQNETLRKRLSENNSKTSSE